MLNDAVTVVDLCQQTAAAHPTALAVEYGCRQLTYAELDAQANHWACLLAERGVGPECLVGICLERSCEAIIALLAVLKAGGAFLPLDPQYPRHRLEFMLRDAATEIVVTDSQRAALLTANNAAIVCLDREHSTTSRQRAALAERRPAPDDLAYAIFTSGSTGRPKAALLAHRGLALMVQALSGPFGVSLGTRVLQFASLSFDASVCEIFMALASGATLCLADQLRLAPGPSLVQTLAALEIEQAILPPSVLAHCPATELPRLKTLVVAGETCSSRLASQWSPGRRLVNAYGPTEATVCATWHECAQGPQPAPPIGRLLPYCQAFILDPFGQPVPTGTSGELYLAGPGLARGYLHRPDLTAERFPTIARPGSGSAPCQPSNLVRVYKTGDIVRASADGDLEFVARADAQIKLRGVRIEPQEIQAVLEEHPAVAAAYVDCQHDALGQPRLVAYAVATANQESTTSHNALQAALIKRARGRLPVGMLPSDIVVVARLPLTPSGKVDVAALRNIRCDRFAQVPRATEPRAPQTSTQRQLLSIWQSILPAAAEGCRSISVTDDFFALGGDSLNALDLLTRIEAGFGRRLQISQLIEMPTVDQLAALLDDDSRGDASRWSPLVALQPRGRRPNLFLMSPGGGNVLCYQSLATALGADQPVYGLQARGVDGLQAPLNSVEAIASEYLAAIRQVQPRGPYALGGWSFGGVVAYEMACQLEAAGESSTRLVLIETGIARSFAVVRAQVSTEEAPSFCLSQGDPETLFARFWQHGPQWGVIPASATEQQARQIYRVFSANVQALLDYRPGCFAGELLLLLAADETTAARHDPEREWARRGSRLTVRRLPGTHFSLLKSPCVIALADALRTGLCGAPSASVASSPPTIAGGMNPWEFTNDRVATTAPTLV